MTMNSPEQMLFHEKTAPKALVAAMQELCERADRNLIEIEGMPVNEAYQLAVETYGDDLPDYWQVWQSWQQEPNRIEMGDL